MDSGGAPQGKTHRRRTRPSRCALETFEQDQRSDQTSSPPTAEWIVHLGMTGRLLVTTPEAPVAAHTHARLTLASRRELRFVDPRRFGRLEFRDLNRGDRFGAPGAEPLTIGTEAFAMLFRGRRLAIKAALLNQTLLAGVGNIYADESLPRRGASTADGGAPHTGRARTAATGSPRGAAAGNPAGRFIRLGLCGRGRREGFLSTRAPGISKDRRAMLGLQNPDPAYRAGGTKHTLLSAVPAIGIGFV